MKWLDKDLGVLELDEYELHVMLASRLYKANAAGTELTSDRGALNVYTIKIVAKNPELAVEVESFAALERSVNSLLELINETDAEFHDEFEHTCDGAEDVEDDDTDDDDTEEE